MAADKHMSRRLIILAVALAMAGCGERPVSNRAGSGSADSTLKPDSEVFGATVHLYDRERVTTAIRADRIVRFEAKDSTMGYVLHVDFFDSLGQISSNLIGDSGVIRERSSTLEVFGRVIVVTEDSARLETDFLRWNPETEKIESDAYVKFTRGDDLMTGWGMEADSDLGRLKIRRQVSGTVSRNQIETE